MSGPSWVEQPFPVIQVVLGFILFLKTGGNRGLGEIKKKTIALFLKGAQAGGRTRGLFGFSLIFSH